jgi:excisionase family DNA binding protein
MVPDLDINAIPREQIPALIAALAARMMTMPVPLADSRPVEDRLMTVDEAAKKLAVTPEWLYRRAKGLGLAVKLGDGTLRFSNTALDAYIKRQIVSGVPARRRRNA